MTRFCHVVACYVGSARAAVVGVALAFASRASAQQAAPVFQLQVDNDLFAVRGGGAPPDYDYTHGTHLSFSWNGGALALAQEIYTPRHNAPSPLPGDRPYAAWLFGEYGYHTLHGPWFGRFAMRGGVTGPPALGEQVQNGIHRLLGNHLELGWAHQLPTRATIDARADETRLLATTAGAGPSRLFEASVGGTVGTMQRSLRAGVQTYLGFGSVHSPTADAPLVA
ncbi:MAG TPA: lipid A-modifier LpxR family protein, partial [Gemmatimonadaceae bacterium]